MAAERDSHLDQGYAADEIGSYGVPAQPAVVRRMRPTLIATRIGAVAAVVAVVLGVVTAVLLPRWSEAATAWSITAVVATALMLGICGLQTWVWHRAMAEWSGRRDVNLRGSLRPSWWAHLLSYPVALVAVVCLGWQARESGMEMTSCWTAVLGAVAVVVAQMTAAVEFLRLDGPPGTLPNHFRRLVRTQNPVTTREDPAASILE